MPVTNFQNKNLQFFEMVCYDDFQNQNVQFSEMVCNIPTSLNCDLQRQCLIHTDAFVLRRLSCTLKSRHVLFFYFSYLYFYSETAFLYFKILPCTFFYFSYYYFYFCSILALSLFVLFYEVKLPIFMILSDTYLNFIVLFDRGK